MVRLHVEILRVDHQFVTFIGVSRPFIWIQARSTRKFRLVLWVLVIAVLRVMWLLSSTSWHVLLRFDGRYVWIPTLGWHQFRLIQVSWLGLEPTRWRESMLSSPLPAFHWCFAHLAILMMLLRTLLEVLTLPAVKNGAYSLTFLAILLHLSLLLHLKLDYPLSLFVRCWWRSISVVIASPMWDYNLAISLFSFDMYLVGIPSWSCSHHFQLVSLFPSTAVCDCFS